jgi:muconolactone delta-isomerase
MKYLVTSKVKDVFYMLPDEQRMVIMGATMSYMERLRKERKISEVHVMPGWNRTMFILEVENQEEASRLSLESPMYSYVDVEAYGLTEWDTWKKQLETAYRQLATAKK